MASNVARVPSMFPVRASRAIRAFASTTVRMAGKTGMKAAAAPDFSYLPCHLGRHLNVGAGSLEELKAGLRKVGSKLAEPEMELLMEATDVNANGYLDYGEFVAITIHLQRLSNDAHLRKALLFFDKDSSGYIERADLANALADDAGHTHEAALNNVLQEV